MEVVAGWGLTNLSQDNVSTSNFFGASVAVRGDGGVFAVGAYGDSTGGTSQGSVTVYRQAGLGAGEVVGGRVSGVWEVARRYTPWSPFSTTYSYFAQAVAFLGEPGSEVLLVGPRSTRRAPTWSAAGAPPPARSHSRIGRQRTRL